MTTSWEMVAGLEIHARIKTTTKLFCSCANLYGSEPNTHICPVCTGQPGSLPVLNEKALELAYQTAQALECELPEHSHFDRKSYFYPDLPMGYQISQYDEPVAQGGCVRFILNGEEQAIRLNRLHVENDAGKLTHKGNKSYADYNRAGTPLMEIVTEADFRSPEQVGAFLRELQNVLRAVGSSDADMEKGQMRCDVNISLRPTGATEFGTKTELKNMNSFRNIEQAVQAEIIRQQDILESGGEIRQETRGWDPVEGVSHPQRSKEEAADYRYFPEPDLPPVVLDQQLRERFLSNSQVELPAARAQRYESLGLSSQNAKQIADDAGLSHYYDTLLTHNAPAKRAANWVLTDVSRELNTNSLATSGIPYPAIHLAQLITLVEEGKITSQTAQDLFSEGFLAGTDPLPLIEERGLMMADNDDELREWAQQALDQNPDALAAYRGGKDKALGAVVGSVMKLSQGKANPQKVMPMLKELAQRS